MNVRRIGIGIVGTGTISTEYATAIAALSDQAVLIAIADQSPAALTHFGRQYFVPFAYHTAEELARRSDIDLIVIATPPSTHETLIRAALLSGKFVICEKPLAHTLSSADRILNESDRAPGRLSIAHQYRYQPIASQLRLIKDSVHSLGRTSIECISKTPLPSPSQLRAWWGKWGIAGGGVVMTRFIHQLDLLINIFGSVEWVEAETRNSIHGLESEEWARMEIYFSVGQLVRAECAISADRPWQEVLRYQGEKGIIEVPWRTGGNKDSSHLPYLKRVIDAIRSGNTLPVSAREARRSIELVTALYQSAREKKRVKLPLTTAKERGLSVENPNVCRAVGGHIS